MDRDLESVQQARDLLHRADVAAQSFARTGQEDVDRIIGALGRACEAAAEPLARAAVEETGMGNVADKVAKNLFCSVDLVNYILPLKTCGIIREIPESGVTELAVPMGVVAALVPTTNPTSTAIYKALIAIKARNAVVMSPHPRAAACIAQTVDVIRASLRDEGAPEDLALVMTVPTLEGTKELMSHTLTAVILATGGYPMVRAAYSSGKPAYGVGPGNVPAIIERTADVPKAVADIVGGKSFDNGVLCSAENSLICDSPVEAQVRHELARQKAVFVTGAERDKLLGVMKDPRTGGISTDVVGQSASAIANMAGIQVPANVRVLVVECAAVGTGEFFSREKLSPVLAFYVEDGWRRCCERSIELLHYGGLGHSLTIHSNDEQVIQRFFEDKPAFRILVNTTSSLGAVGYTTGLAPAMTLGPGAWAGSSTSDNITPLHLINIKRLAREIKPYRFPQAAEDTTAGVESLGGDTPVAADVQRAVEAFLAGRRQRT